MVYAQFDSYGINLCSGYVPMESSMKKKEGLFWCIKKRYSSSKMNR